MISKIDRTDRKLGRFDIVLKLEEVKNWQTYTKQLSTSLGFPVGGNQLSVGVPKLFSLLLIPLKPPKISLKFRQTPALSRVYNCDDQSSYLSPQFKQDCHIFTYKFLSYHQSGFRSLHSTLSALIEATVSWAMDISRQWSC